MSTQFNVHAPVFVPNKERKEALHLFTYISGRLEWAKKLWTDDDVQSREHIHTLVLQQAQAWDRLLRSL